MTGSALDAPTILFFLSSPGEVGAIIFSEVTPGLIVLLLITLLYALFGPWLLTRSLDRPRSWSRTEIEAPTLPWLGFAGSVLVAYALFSLALLPGGGPAGASETFARDAFVNVAMSEVAGPADGRLPYAEAEEVRETMPTQTKLEPTEDTRKRNVVLIHMESARARSATPYNPEIETTPFLDELSRKSIFAERAYTIVPHTTNALVATICGIDPPTRQDTASVGDDIPARCLPELLGGRAYNSVYFTSSVQTFERRPEVVKQMGYEEFYPVETMDKKGFEKANYFGYEDDIMLEPSKKWLQENGDEPFAATYETITPHHQYLAPDERYGRLDFAEDDILNRYLNSARYVDFFVKNLIEQYKDLGLYGDTVFVIMGDHGEAFGEHGVKGHDGVPYEEGLRVPFIIHDPQRWQDGERIEDAPTNHLDVAPTVLDLLGFEVTDGDYPGATLLGPLHTERPLFASCRPDLLCMASIEGDEKYIYHYGKRPAEYYDLSEDPLEKKDIAGQIPQEELNRRREELLEWRSAAASLYDKPNR